MEKEVQFKVHTDRRTIQVRSNWGKWSDLRISDYTLSLRISGASSSATQLTLDVHGDQIYSQQAISSETNRNQHYVIEGLFKRAFDYWLFLCVVEYDSEYGYPTLIDNRFTELGERVEVIDFQPDNSGVIR